MRNQILKRSITYYTREIEVYVSFFYSNLDALILPNLFHFSIFCILACWNFVVKQSFDKEVRHIYSKTCNNNFLISRCDLKFWNARQCFAVWENICLTHEHLLSYHSNQSLHHQINTIRHMLLITSVTVLKIILFTCILHFNSEDFPYCCRIE